MHSTICFPELLMLLATLCYGSSTQLLELVFSSYERGQVACAAAVHQSDGVVVQTQLLLRGGRGVLKPSDKALLAFDIGLASDENIRAETGIALDTLSIDNADVDADVEKDARGDGQHALQLLIVGVPRYVDLPRGVRLRAGQICRRDGRHQGAAVGRRPLVAAEWRRQLPARSC
jgi:hypothetical protein